MFLSSLQKNKWKSEKDTTLKTDLETDAEWCLKKIKKKKKQNKPNKNRMKYGKEVFTVKLLTALKINRENSEKSVH